MKNDTSSASSSPSTRVQKQSIERLKTHANDYAKNFIYVHSPHYRLNCCNGIYGESWDGWTDGRGGRALAAGARMDWVVNVHFDVSEMPSRRHRVALAPLLPHESSSNPPFSSSAGSPPLRPFEKALQEQMCGNSLKFKWRENGLYCPGCISRNTSTQSPINSKWGWVTHLGNSSSLPSSGWQKWSHLRLAHLVTWHNIDCGWATFTESRSRYIPFSLVHYWGGCGRWQVI